MKKWQLQLEHAMQRLGVKACAASIAVGVRPACVLLLLAVASDGLLAQSRRRDPHLAYAFPGGCQQGRSCEIVLGGQYLKEATDIYVAGSGATAEVVRWYRPMTAGEYNNLRMKLREAREQLIEKRTLNRIEGDPTADEVAEEAGVTPYQQREMEVYLQRTRDPKRQPNDQLEEQLTVRLTVDSDAAVGKRELRVLTENAISNPLWIHIGNWPEFNESEPNDDVPDYSIERLPTVVNGQITPGDVDRFVFDAREGMKLVIAVAARDVIPYLADAVPGWFQAVIRLTDATGQEVGFADSFYFSQDPVLYFVVPRDGRYTVEIRDSLYRGREDFVYRMTIGEIPYLTGIFPMGARVDSRLTVQLRGWNLTQNKLEIETMSRRQYRPVRWYTASQGSGNVIRFPLQIDHWPEVVEREPNDHRSQAEAISNRITINGRIDQPGDQDLFLIRSGGRLVAEVHARRLGSPLDSTLTLTDAQGNEIGFNDDHVDQSQSLQTHHADSHLRASIPAQGDHFLQVTDAQGRGGPEFSYRLTLRAPIADYELRVSPSSIMARAGQNVPITAFALRRDGFDQDIELKLVDAPQGFQIDGGMIPGNRDQVRLTLQVPREAAGRHVTLEMEGSAPRRLRSRSTIVRPVVPAENMMQAFIWYHLVPVEHWNIVISNKTAPRMPLGVVKRDPFLYLPRGGDFLLEVVTLAKGIASEQMRVQLSQPPEGVTASMISDPNGKLAIKISTDADVVEPGLRGNLLFSLFKEVTPAPTESNPNPSTRRTDYGYMPAIPFEVSKRKTFRRRS